MITKEQYERWKDFSIRMAKTCFKRKRNPNWEEILYAVEGFFEMLEYNEDWMCIVDWDSSEPYPEGHPHFRRTYQCLCWHCHGLKKSDCSYNCEDGHIYDYAEPLCPSDMCKECYESWNPHYWEDLSETQLQKYDEQFCGPITCCIRAGLDMGVAPSAGVIGFTAGDIRKMYPEGVPDWITGGKEHRWSYWLSDKLNGTFKEMPDEAGLVL